MSAIGTTLAASTLTFVREHGPDDTITESEQDEHLKIGRIPEDVATEEEFSQVFFCNNSVKSCPLPTPGTPIIPVARKRELKAQTKTQEKAKQLTSSRGSMIETPKMNIIRSQKDINILFQQDEMSREDELALEKAVAQSTAR